MELVVLGRQESIIIWHWSPLISDERSLTIALVDAGLAAGRKEKKNNMRGEGIRTPTVPFAPSAYKALREKLREEWDKLAQNPFLAFYQRWPWLAQHTPLLNLWNPHVRHSRRFYCFVFGCWGF